MKPMNLFTLAALLMATPLCATSLVIGTTDTTDTAKPFLQVWGTLATADTTSGSSSAYCVDSVVVNANGTLSLAEGITVPSTGSLGGTGTVTGAVTFSDGATLDATSGSPLSVTGTVAHNGKTQITLSTAPTETTQLLAITSESTPTAPTDYSVTADGSEVTGALVTAGSSGLYVSVPVSETSSMVVETTDSSGTTTSTELSDDAKAVILDAITNTEGASSVASVTISGTTNTAATDSSGASAATTLTATQLEGALTCFEGVTSVTTATDSETGATVAQATVSYNFGISELRETTIEGTRYIVVGVGVEKSDGTAATYASGTTIALTSGSSTISATEVTSIEGTSEGSTSTSGMKYFRIPLTAFTGITSPIAVKATNEGTASVAL